MKAVITYSPSSRYDDLPELRYHFPRQYLRAMERAIGDWVIYYEPRRTRGEMSHSGRSSYFAVARLIGITPDEEKADHYYAEVADYLEFDRAVGFREGNHFYESRLRNKDGTTNKGAFRSSVRSLPDEEYQVIINAGFSAILPGYESDSTELMEVDRSVYTELSNRKFRDRRFRIQVRAAYNNRCAISGLQLTNGGGRPEVEAAHIRPVSQKGPDSVRNGIALTGTVHWLFDRGLISLSDEYRVLVSSKGLPAQLGYLFEEGKKIFLPNSKGDVPHLGFLAWHRENCFKP